MPRRENPQYRPRRRSRANTWLPWIIAALIAGSIGMIYLSIHLAFKPSAPAPQTNRPSVVQPEDPKPEKPHKPKKEKETQPPPEPEHVVSTATISATGDLLMHSTIFAANAAVKPECYRGEGDYNFDSIFKFVKDYTSAADYAIANLETPFTDRKSPIPAIRSSIPRTRSWTVPRTQASICCSPPTTTATIRISREF